MHSIEEKRQFHRVTHDAEANLSADGRDWPCTVRNLSLKGCLLHTPGNWQLDPQRTYCVSISLASDVQIGMEVVPVYQQGELAGFRCVAIDLDGLTTLRRLLELNLGDPALLEGELRKLGHGAA